MMHMALLNISDLIMKELNLKSNHKLDLKYVLSVLLSWLYFINIEVSFNSKITPERARVFDSLTH